MTTRNPMAVRAEIDLLAEALRVAEDAGESAAELRCRKARILALEHELSADAELLADAGILVRVQSTPEHHVYRLSQAACDPLRSPPTRSEQLELAYQKALLMPLPRRSESWGPSNNH